MDVLELKILSLISLVAILVFWGTIYIFHSSSSKKFYNLDQQCQLPFDSSAQRSDQPCYCYCALLSWIGPMPHLKYSCHQIPDRCNEGICSASHHQKLELLFVSLVSQLGLFQYQVKRTRQKYSFTIYSDGEKLTGEAQHKKEMKANYSCMRPILPLY